MPFILQPSFSGNAEIEPAGLTGIGVSLLFYEGSRAGLIKAGKKLRQRPANGYAGVRTAMGFYARVAVASEELPARIDRPSI
jgi:hypothetical protein